MFWSIVLPMPVSLLKRTMPHTIIRISFSDSSRLAGSNAAKFSKSCSVMMEFSAFDISVVT